MATKPFTGYFGIGSGSVSDWSAPQNLIDGDLSTYCQITGRYIYYFLFSLQENEIDDFLIRVKCSNNQPQQLRFVLAYGNRDNLTSIAETTYSPAKNEQFIVPFTFSTAQKQEIKNNAGNLLFGMTEQRAYMTGFLDEIELIVPDDANKVFVADQNASALYIGGTKANSVYIGTTQIL